MDFRFVKTYTSPSPPTYLSPNTPGEQMYQMVQESFSTQYARHLELLLGHNCKNFPEANEVGKQRSWSLPVANYKQASFGFVHSKDFLDTMNSFMTNSGWPVVCKKIPDNIDEIHLNLDGTFVI